ncbi:hypothetical protein ACG02S_24470 [Roseateles sp. DC23W]|uniref:Beta-barrel porin 2 n=1 Tax=Pelomonas dachongensis TaxID=3299029 RepID=A0ABW7EUC2_9BURK
MRATLLLAAAAAGLPCAQAQTDDTAPFYAGASLGASRVSNIYRQPNATNDDTVVSTGLLGGIDQRLGRQHVTLDGTLQDNRYSSNKDLNNRSYNLRGALNWQTIGNLSGTLSAKSSRSLADFNIGNGIDPIFRKNIERNDEYQAKARLGVLTRYTVEAGWTHREREFSAEEYARFVYRQDTGSLGVYATPGANVRLGLVGRHTKGLNPRYPVGIAVDPGTQQPVIVSAANDYTRDDIDFTTNWATGGSSTLNTRISRSKTNNSLDGLRDISGTTGAVGWNWRPTGKLQLNVQYSRDTGQESTIQAADLNRVYTSWQLGGDYALTGKISLSAKASSSRSRRASESGVVVSDAMDDSKFYNLGLRWTISRGLSLACQYDRASRDSSIAQYVYTASSYGCTGQAILY